MKIEEMTIEQLRQTAKSLDVTFGPNTGDDLLREKIENALIAKKVRQEEEIRMKLQLEFKLKHDMAEIKEAAEYANIKFTYPDEPTIQDVVRLKKKLGLELKKPKPSPETIGIEASKRGIYKFTNVDSKDVDVILQLGEKYFFHLWPRKKFVLPEFAVKIWEDRCVVPAYKQQLDPLDGVEKSVRDYANDEKRFIFEYQGPAPADAEFGIVI